MKKWDRIRSDYENAAAVPEACETDDIRFTILPAEPAEGGDPDAADRRFDYHSAYCFRSLT